MSRKFPALPGARGGTVTADTILDLQNAISDVELSLESQLQGYLPITGGEMSGPITGLDDLVPTGAWISAGFISAPDGWLLCDGTAVSRIAYANLFAAISTRFGVGDGSTTFNLPDFEERMELGFKDGTNNVGDTGGSFDHTHTGPSHTHGGGSHSHTGTASGTTGTSLLGTPTSTRTVTDDGTSQQAVASSTHGHPSHSHSFSDGFSTSSNGITTAAGGTGATGSNNPPYLVGYRIIKT